MKKLSVLFLIVASASYGTLLQEAIDRAPSGSTLKLASGTYPGAIIIDKPITIIGKEDGVIIKGDNLGSVVTISSSHVILKNLTITGSGGRMENLDSAITIKSAKACEISHCRILDSLYGIDLAMVDDSVIADNYITSKKNEIAFRGDALKIWYCNHNLIKNNTIERTRDVTLAYSNNNTIENNHFFYNRFALHLSMSKQNSVKNNHFQYNSVAVMVMGAKDTEIVNNSIKSCRGAAGIGVVLKGVSNLLFENNIVSFNAEGLYIDSTGGEEGMQRYIKNNEISYNKEAIHFHAEIKNNTMTHNRIFGNIDDVVKGAWGSSTHSNIIQYNYWDRYAGFDTDHNNIGDTPHRIYQHADQLWHYNHKVKFFYGAPVMSLLNFLVQVAPFVEPVLLLEDRDPLVKMK